MLSLGDISIQDIKEFLIYKFNKSWKSDDEKFIIKMAYDLLEENNIDDCLELKNFLDNFVVNEYAQLKILKDELIRVMLKLKKAKISDIEDYGVIFDVNNYINSGIDMLSLEKTDRETSCSRLIQFNPTGVHNSLKARKFNSFSVYQVKVMSGKYIIDSSTKKPENALIASIKSFGLSDYNKTKNAISFYEEQVIRQAIECGYKEKINYFDLNKKEKEMIVRDKYKDIIEYLIFLSDDYIWGNLTSNQKALMLKSIYSFDDNIVRNNFVNIFSDYTTLSELESLDSSLKVLKRFIVDNKH